MSKPTWANHPAIFHGRGPAGRDRMPTSMPAGRGLDFPAMLAALKQIPAGDIVLLHACCHNPTGIDPTPDQWQEIADVVHERGLLPLVDFAYQGFGDGLAEDAVGLRELAKPGQRAAGVQLVLEELWPLRRAGRRADASSPATQMPPSGRSVAGAGQHPHELQQSADARRGDRRRGARRRRTAQAVGAGAGRDARPHPPDAAAVRRDDAAESAAARFFVPGRPEGDVLVFRPDEHAGR